jgi:hypothetical protein
MNMKQLHSLTFLRRVEDAIRARLDRNVSLDDISAIELEQLWFLAQDPANADNRQLERALNAILVPEWGLR